MRETPNAEPLSFDIREALRQLRRDEMWTGMRTENSRAASERTDSLVEHIVTMYESAVKREERLRSALESWGRHHHWCTSLEAIGEDYLPCDCGLSAALTAAPAPRAPETESPRSTE